MSAPEPAADEADSGRTFTDNLRRFFRRERDMVDDPIDLGAATALGAVYVWVVTGRRSSRTSVPAGSVPTSTRR
jgi:hypothetical protein